MRLQSLEGWRGLTAFLVILFHLYVAHFFFFAEWLRYLAPVLEFFFLTSGFVMALGFSDKVKNTRQFGAYMIRRVGRVWPLHLAMLGLLLLIPLSRLVLGTPGDLFSGKLSLEALPYQLFMLQTWRPEFALTWNHPAWTLTGEFFAYVLMALIVWFAPKERMRWVLALITIGVSLWFYWGAMQRSDSYNVTSVSRAVFAFFIGFLLYHVWRRFPLRDARVAQVLEIVSAAGFLAILFWHPSGAAYFLCHAVYVLMIYVYASDLGFCSKVMSTKPLLWLGKYSFSIYMFHGVVTTWLMLIVHAIEARSGMTLTASVPAPGAASVHLIDLPEAWMNNALLAGYIVFVLVGSWVVFHVVEQPSRQYFSRLGSQFARGGAEAPRPVRQAQEHVPAE